MKTLAAEVEVEVEFQDVDPMGVAWHGHYLKYFERARCALLRSFGAPRQFLYWRHFIENIFLANFAALAAIVSLAVLHETLFGTLGFPRAVLDFSGGNPYTSAAVLSILFWVNLGAFLSSVPVAVGLRQSVGAILN